MKKLLLIALVFLFTLPLLYSQVNYLSDDEYKNLSSAERSRYNENLKTEMANLQTKKAESLAQKESLSKDIENLKAELAATTAEYDQVHGRILQKLGVNPAEIAGIKSKIDAYNQKIANWEKLSDDELWQAKKDIQATIEEYNNYRKSKYGKVPDYRREFSDLDRRIASLERTVNSAKPKYYEENYSVRKNDTLSKISGYDFIYGDPSKWGIIYRANRDQIKDPNIIYVDQVLKIPRGLPNSWKVYKGEYLWKIASYPEVYGSGAKWPLIYRANKDQIKDPNLIYPGQVLTIPRD